MSSEYTTSKQLVLEYKSYGRVFILIRFGLCKILLGKS